VDRRAAEGDVALLVAERLASSDAKLLAHQIDAGHHLGDRMLHLETRVHLEEKEITRVVVE
jgi:hypothetical protein